MGGADGRQRVNIKLYDRLNINIPNKDTMDSFGRVVAPMFKTIHTLELRNTNLRKTRDLLLPRLISGELSVESLKTLKEAI